MKKIIAIAASLVLVASAANAQSGFFNALKNVTSGLSSDSASSIINTVLGTVAGELPVDLSGTWTYQGCAVAADGENVLKNIAANAAMSSVEAKLDEGLAKVGINPGVATITFAKDYNFTLTAGKINVNGTWEQDGNRVVLKFGKLYNYLTMVGTAKNTTNGCEILFDASKFTTFAQKVIDIISKISSNSLLATVSSLISQVDGMKAGLKLSK